jgi:hypothetical protein
MRATKTHKEAEYEGKVLQAKDNIIIETAIGPNSARITAPVDFVDGELAKYEGRKIRVTITIAIEVAE